MIEDIQRQLERYKEAHFSEITHELEKYWECWINQYFKSNDSVSPSVATEELNKEGQKKRINLSEKYLLGNGIEIGALHNPLSITNAANVKYVDQYPNNLLRLHYPELGKYNFVHVDIVDNGERLDSINEGSLDFVICNHFLEHCENPIGAIKNHFRILTKWGVLFYAIPDKRFTFDSIRDTTSFEHIVLDYHKGADSSRSQHYQEWSAMVNGKTGIEHDAWWRFLEIVGYSIHFHVWTQKEMLEMFLNIKDLLQIDFDVQESCMNLNEIIFILRKP